MPGGFVVVHTGLLALADSAEEVAGVLAHEIQHVEKRHSLKAIAKNAGLMVTISMVFGDLGGLVSLGQDLIGLEFSRPARERSRRRGPENTGRGGHLASGHA
jgi:Zn-dependent protease with chaperone function